MLSRVTEILTESSEQDKVYYSSSEFVILPDMKWDLHTTGSLYLIAIARDSTLRSLRDLRGEVHLGLLKSIRREAYRLVGEKWGIGRGGLRMCIHYQPSYCMSLSSTWQVLLVDYLVSTDHFHVHIINVNYEMPGLGMTVGQAHLLDDVISLVSGIFFLVVLSVPRLIDPMIVGSCSKRF